MNDSFNLVKDGFLVYYQSLDLTFAAFIWIIVMEPGSTLTLCRVLSWFYVGEAGPHTIGSALPPPTPFLFIYTPPIGVTL